MKIGHCAPALATAVALILGCAAPALAQAGKRDNWIGAWGFVPTPLPPGITPPPGAAPATLADAPLGNPPPTALPLPPAPTPPLLDNPGGLPVVAADTDPVNVTVRQLVRVAVAGKRIRLRFSNEAGSEVLKLGPVHVGAAGPDGTILAGSDHAVTFDGHANVILPASAPVLSDAVEMPVTALEKLVVSIHVPGTLGRAGHALFQYVAPGDAGGAAIMQGAKIMRLPALVTQIDVDATSANAAIVTLGDSITEGAQSTNNAFRGWPDRLAERLAAAHSRWSVVNAGIGGNRLLRYGSGPNALARLDRDVFSVSGIKAIILLEGINDIGRGFFPPTEPVTAEALEAACKQIIARAHAKGIKVYGATLTPYRGAHYFMEDGEKVREAYNGWIRSSGAFDGVVELAPSVADKADATTFAPGFNLNDKLHPNDAGYQAMADAIDLNMLK